MTLRTEARADALGERPSAGFGLEISERRVRAKLLGVDYEPLRVGRYALERELGAGGMGSVWLASDDELGRPVAIKFLREELDSELARQRLLAEAQSLAQLAHPNVVGVYDVGRYRGQIWIAMEYVPGRTLREWVAAEGPSERERLRRWIEAGRGLAAVHAAGLVHRDVKPDNVLIGDDGRVRLIDLGLVRGLAITSTAGGTPPPTTGSSAPTLTTTGAFLGTRAYAAPEQLEGGSIDARADQFAFCVSVWESLCGVRPHALAPGARAPAGLRGRPRVRRALARGLAREPGARFDSMEALLERLEDRRAAWLLGSVLVLGVGSGAFAGMTMTQADTVAATPCSATARPIDALLEGELHARALAGLEPRGRAATQRVLDDWSARWREAAHTSCAEVHVEQTRSAGSLDLRRACLDDALLELEVVLEALEVQGPRLDLGAAFASVRDPQTCLSASVLERQADPLPAAELETATELRRALVGLRIDGGARSLELRRVEARRARSQVEALGHVDLRGYALVVSAELALAAGDHNEARDLVAELIDLAMEIDDSALLASGWHMKALVELDLELDLDVARWTVERELALAERLERDPRRLGKALVSRGRIALAEGRLVDAQVDLGAAVDAFARGGPSNDGLRIKALRNLATALNARGATDEALARFAEASELAGREPLDAGVDPRGLEAYQAAEILVEDGQFERAQERAEDALREYEAELGPGRDVADAHVLLAKIAVVQGQLERSREHAAAADRILRTLFGSTDRDRVESQTALGNVAFYMGDFEAAAQAYTLALTVAERGHRSSSELGLARANLGETLGRLGQHHQARAMLERAIVELERELGSDHPVLDVPRKALGASCLALGELEQARRELERTLEGLHARANNPVEEADTRWLLAQTLDELGERERALALAREAVAQMTAETALDPALRAELEDWIRDHENNR